MSNENSKYFVQMNDGRTSYEIAQEDYQFIKEYLEHPNKNTKNTYELKQRKHDKKEELWETRTIILNQVLSLNCHESKEHKEKKDYAVALFFAVKKGDAVETIENIKPCIFYITEKNYKFLEEKKNNNSEVELGKHGLPSIEEIDKNFYRWYYALIGKV